jgi:hypothetical protein
MLKCRGDSSHFDIAKHVLNALGIPASFYKESCDNDDERNHKSDCGKQLNEGNERRRDDNFQRTEQPHATNDAQAGENAEAKSELLGVISAA